MVRRNENMEITLGSSKNAVSQWYSDLKYTGLSQFRKSEKKKNYLYPLSTQNNVALFSCFTHRFFFFTFVFLSSSFLVSQDFCIFAMSGTGLSEFRLKCVEGQHFLSQQAVSPRVA